MEEIRIEESERELGDLGAEQIVAMMMHCLHKDGQEREDFGIENSTASIYEKQISSVLSSLKGVPHA